MDLENQRSMTIESDGLAVDRSADPVRARRVCVFVLGMHRSGSSAITRMLSLLGCALPKTLMTELPSNPTGHWESQRIAILNDEILTQAGTTWDDWLPVNPRLADTLIWPQLVQRGRELVREEFADAPLYVLKDPRCCKLIGFWTEVLASESVDAAFVLPMRNPVEVARSLAARDGIHEYYGLLVWLRHVLTAESETRGRPRVFTDYAALISDWEEIAHQMSSALGVVWPRTSAMGAAEISRFLSPELRHHVSEIAELGNNPAISSWVRQAYEVMLGWAQQGEKPDDYKVLDEISRAFDESSIAFARPMLNIVEASRRALQAEAHLASISSENEEIFENFREREGELALLRAERHVFVAENAALLEERAEIKSHLGALESDLGQVRAERDLLSDDHAAVNHERDHLARQLGEIEADVGLVRIERDALMVERDRIASWHTALTKDRDNVTAQLSVVNANLNSVSSERVALRIDRDQLTDKLAIFAEARAKLARELADTQRELSQANIENAAMNIGSARFAQDLAAVESRADELVNRNAVAESTLRQREEEIDQLGVELQTACDAKEAQATAAADAAEALTILEAVHAASLIEVERAAVKVQAALGFDYDRARRAEANLTEIQSQMADRFAELAYLTRLLRETERKIVNHEEQTEWLRRISDVKQTGPYWWALMSPRWRRHRELRRLQRKGIFDSTAYLARYPDVVAARIDPLLHYLRHGLAEGRTR